MYSQGKPLKQIKIHLDTQGIKPRRAKLWSIGTLHKMLMNKTYIGEYVWRDKESGKSFPITVPKIITHSLFNRVQKMLHKNTRNRGNNRRTTYSLLGDFLTCYCGQKITGTVRKSVGRKVYECSSKHNYWKGKLVEECFNRRSMNMDATDQFIINSVKDVMCNSSTIKERFKRDVMDKKEMDAKTIEFEKELREKKIERLDYELDTSTKAIATNRVNHMLEQTSDDLFNEVDKQLTDKRILVENEKSQYIGEINDLDNRREWIDWITGHGDKIEQDFDNWENNIGSTTDLLRGMITSIKVHPVNGLNRDDVEKQVGHKLVINFKQPIVKDSIKYNDKNDKSKGYNLVKGKKRLDVGEIKILKGGRGKKHVDISNALNKNYDNAKKAQDIVPITDLRGKETCTFYSIPQQWNN
jgi:NAD-dependent SIR2 family protein deacetylase